MRSPPYQKSDTSTSSANSSSEGGPNKSSDAPSDDAVLETETPSPSNPTGDGSDEKLSVEDVGKPNIRTTTLGSGSNKLQIRHISQEMILHNPLKATADSGKYRQFDLEIRCDSGEAALSGGFWLRTSTTKVMSSRTAGEVYYLTMEAGPGDHQTEINVNCLIPLS